MSDYAAARAERLLTLLEDVESWRVIRDHARDLAHPYPVGSRPHVALIRLATACESLLDLIEVLEEAS